MDEMSPQPPTDYWCVPPHEGQDYGWFLRQLHAHLAPARYLEIGTLNGGTLKLSSAASLAIDPAFQIETDVIGRKPALHLMQMTSDAFFAGHDAVGLLGGAVDLAFLDGMHHYQFLLRDFLNTEQACRRNSVIAMHDCLPHDSYVARRDPADMRHHAWTLDPDWWAGDVWKAVAILRLWRPELRIYGVATPPTGLILVTNLDPRSRRLQDSYFEAVEPLVEAGHEAFMQFTTSLTMLDQAEFASLERISQRFWL